MTYGRKGTSISKQLSDEEQSSVHAKNLKEGMALSDKGALFIEIMILIIFTSKWDNFINKGEQLFS